ncbi:MAG: histidine phosphatase family protein [Methylocella sp.]
MPTRFCLVRHGETAWNAEGRLQGQTDIPLNETGRAQAKAAAARLATQSFDALYSSDLTRTFETAAVAAAQLGLEAQRTQTLRERFFGAFQGLTHAEAQMRYPADYASFRAREPDRPLPGGGESLGAFSARVAAAFAGLADKHRGEMLLVVTHGGVLDIAHRLASGQSLMAKRDFPLLNAALNWIERRDGRWVLLSWGETDHLARARDEVFDGAELSAVKS